MEALLDFFHNDYVLLTGLLITVLAILWIFVLQIKIIKLENRYKKFINKFENNDIEKTIKDYFDLVNQVNEENKIIIAENKNMERRIDTCIQKFGIVKYNAFDDVGNELSFAIALLDNNNNGLVLNGVYSRNSSNIYSKPIKEGKSEIKLSEEEKIAIKKAIEQK